MNKIILTKEQQQELLNKRENFKKQFQPPSKEKLEKREILNWFNRNDYIINKVFLGEWETNDVRYLNYLKERKIKRDRLDELDVIINSN